MLGFFAMILVSCSPVAFAQDQKNSEAETAVATPAPVQKTNDLSKRIETLQSTKTCIYNAKNKSDIAQCRTSIQIKREQIKTH